MSCLFIILEPKDLQLRNTFLMDLASTMRDLIQEVPGFPKPGILFKDITPIFSEPEVCAAISQHIARRFPDIDAIAGIESRGFFWGMLVAQELQIPFVPIRKAGKLPRATRRQSYNLEYGEAALEIHEDAILPNWQVLIHDDLLATGGTARAAAHLVNQLGQCVGFSFLVELSFLQGREQLSHLGLEIDTLLEY